MAKEISSFIKLQVPAGKANPSPPIGPALGQHGVNIMEFCKAFNAQTQGTRYNHSGGDHCLQGSLIYLYYQNTSCTGSDQKSPQIE